MIDAYRAADVVLDQFLIGTFGAVAPEAMACGTPVLMAFEPSLHEWCFPELPRSSTCGSRSRSTASYAGSRATRRHGPSSAPPGRDRVERHHGWQLVVDRLVAAYEEVTGYSQSRS